MGPADEYIFGLDYCDVVQLEQFHAEREQRPDLAPYVGPGESLERFLAGDFVTHQQFVWDDSKWVARNILPAQMRRLSYMLERTQCDEARSGIGCHCRPWPGEKPS